MNREEAIKVDTVLERFEIEEKERNGKPNVVSGHHSKT